VVALSKSAPTDEEMDQVRSYDGEEDALGMSEKFFRSLEKIPRVDKRLECFLFKIRFEAIVSDIDKQIALCERAANALKENSKLRKVLEVSLALGNYLNGGTKKGHAYGFKIDTINKLKATKSSDNKINLLHFLVRSVNHQNPEASRFTDDLLELLPASRIDTTALNTEVTKVRLLLNKVESELKQSDHDPNIDRFVPVMSNFMEESRKKGAELEDRIKLLDQTTVTLCAYFGEEKMKLEELFKLFSDFVADYKEAEAFLEKLRIQEEREEKKNPKPNVIVTDEKGESGEGDEARSADGKATGAVDKVVSSLKVTDPHAIMQMIRERRKNANQHKGKRLSS